MPQTTIRQLTSEEALDMFYPGNAYAFAASPPLRDKEEWQGFLRDRQEVTYFALFEDSKLVSNAASTPIFQNVRGKIYPISGIWSVVTHPGSRRKGYSRAVMTRLLQELRTSGHALTCLYPFRESFYERMGYVTFPLPKIARFSPLNFRSLLKGDLGGEVELLSSVDHFDSYLDFMRSMQVKVHGMGLFKHIDPAAIKRFPTWLAIARTKEEIVAMMSYRLSGENPTQFKMEVPRFYYHTSQGRYLLLQWIARHSDQASEVSVTLPAFEHPETWLSDLQVKIETAIRAAMGRVLDVSAIAGMSVNPGAFNARITDVLCPWNEGIWRFESLDGELQVSPTEVAECELNIQALSALIYGTHDPGDFTFRGWGSVPTEQQAVMRSMFPAALPHMHEYF